MPWPLREEWYGVQFVFDGKLYRGEVPLAPGITLCLTVEPGLNEDGTHPNECLTSGYVLPPREGLFARVGAAHPADGVAEVFHLLEATASDRAQRAESTRRLYEAIPSALSALSMAQFRRRIAEFPA